MILRFCQEIQKISDKAMPLFPYDPKRASEKRTLFFMQFIKFRIKAMNKLRQLQSIFLKLSITSSK